VSVLGQGSAGAQPGSLAAAQAAAQAAQGSAAGGPAVGWSVGLSFEIPLGNHEAKARKELADLEVRKAGLGLQRAAQQVTEEVNVASRAVTAARKQLEVSQEATRTAETKYQNELERVRAGRTTAHILANVQSDLLKEQTGLAQAQAEVQKALADLWTATGSLLPRLGLG
jgi:outer membrane protein TolC